MSRVKNLFEYAKKKTAIGKLASYVKKQLKEEYKQRTDPPANCGSCPFAMKKDHPVGVSITMCMHPLRPEKVMAMNNQLPPLHDECVYLYTRDPGTVFSELQYLALLKVFPKFGGSSLLSLVSHLKNIKKILSEKDVSLHEINEDDNIEPPFVQDEIVEKQHVDPEILKRYPMFFQSKNPF